PVPYLDSAVRALRNHGLIALTATDMAPLCGVHPKACIRKYGGRPLRAEYCHELAIRLLAGCLATVAAKHEMGINPVFSHNAEHYIRLYATVEYGVKNADESLRSMGFVFHCFKCFHREGLHGFSAAGHSGKCSECDAKLVVGGPLWLGKLVDKNFCEFMLDSARKRNFRLSNKIERTLSSAIAQLETIVGYYVVDRLCDVLNLPVPSVARVVDALKKKGFQASPTHFNPKGIKTDASAAKVKETLLEITRR
ncbi:MAG: hypothetical protein QXJ02_05835, partial [Candidatus Bathyarchaeia archaeon]